MQVLVLAALLAAVTAQPPVWYPDGTCGVSPLPDAGEGCPVNSTCTNIIGGIDARANEFPFMASLRDPDHFCGGVVVHNRWIMTSAQCTIGRMPGDFQVAVGTVARAPGSGEVLYDVEAMLEHELYDSSAYDHDISLIKTTTDIVFDANLNPICASDPADMLVDATGEIIGWGSPEVGSPHADTLQYTSVQVYDNAYCQQLYTGEVITDGMMCASDDRDHDDRDTCDGDAGGPLAVKDGAGVYHVTGLTSWGYGCAGGYPGMFTRVGFYASWVTDKIEKN